MKNKIKNILMDYNLIAYEDNVVWAERAFKINSITQYYIRKISENELTSQEIEYFATILQMFLNKEVDLFWEDGVVKIK